MTRALRQVISSVKHCLAIAALVSAWALLCVLNLDAVASPDAEVLFATKIQPLLVEKCLACHGAKPEDIKGDLDLRTLAGALKGGESGEPSLIPGDPLQSPLFAAVTWNDDALQMPPKENDRLSAAQIALLREWISAGAPWPSQERIDELLKTANAQWSDSDGIRVATSGGLADAWTNRRYDPANLWAYRPLRGKDERGRMKDDNDVSPSNLHPSPIDTFIDQRLAVLDLPAAPAADRRTLIRRVTFDLIGLPPTPDEIEAFINDSADDNAAFATVVERLLASPHYGEQYARHWLDVVRYADSSGFANDYERGNAWRYRDYVIRAFNRDKPYDQFLIEQIAGDELLEELTAKNEIADSRENSVSQLSTLNSQPSDLLLATGFLRMGPWELTGMEVAKIARQRFLDDVTDAVGQVFLGHMLQCARCHDHKFDPVPTRDYYSIQAAFATTQLAEREAPFLPEENTSGFDERKYLDQRRDFYQQALADLDRKQTLDAARAWYAEQRLNPQVFEDLIRELAAIPNRQGDVTVAEVRRSMQQRKIPPDQIPPRHVGFEPRDFGIERVARKGLERLRWRYDRYEPIALSVYSGRTPELKSVYAPLRMPDNRLTAGELEETCILAGGDPFSPTQPVTPGVLSVVALDQQNEGTEAEETPDVSQSFSQLSTLNSQPSRVSGRRLALARWIASEENPLTARVMVNRVWQWHFGQALAGNPNNFGTTGKKPTHPELLDWLAREFIDSGWSVKHLHRCIVMSHAYRRSTQHPQPELVAEKDPNGISYAVFHPRRLSAEELRDAMLFVSGEVNVELGGIPARPEMNLEAALQPRMVMGTFAEAWQPSPLPSQRHRRSIYALKLRGQRDPFQEVFNAPSPDLSCEAREASTVTPQVFALFNSEATMDRAVAVSRKLRVDGRRPDNARDSGTIRELFLKLYGREATPDEVAACGDHWRRMTERHRTLDLPLSSPPTEVVREGVEENTGERFTFTEPLEAYVDFVPDAKLQDVSPDLRGLAELCLVLLNSNEFAYVY